MARKKNDQPGDDGQVETQDVDPDASDESGPGVSQPGDGGHGGDAGESVAGPDTEIGANPADDEVEPVPGILKAHVKLARAAALGNGTRKRGTVLGVVTIEGGAPYWPSFEPAEGVEDIEWLTALKNPHLLEDF